jgi:hypothetical protein
MEVNHTKGYVRSDGRDSHIRVICPDCGSGGGSHYPCWCSECEPRVLMVPYRSNWNEVFKQEVSKL